MKSDALEKEIQYINDDRIKNSLRTLLNMLPDYFYQIPASSTGKYHPSFSLGEGGLVRHVKVAVRIAIELFNDSAVQNFTQKEKNLIIFSLIIHDGLKSGITQSQYTVYDHPILISNFIKENKDKIELTDEELSFVSGCVETHSGPWTGDRFGNKILREPTTKYERFVHLCDYLSSKKFIDVKFINNEIDLN